MSRSPALVRPAVVDDAESLLPLWRDLVRRPGAEGILGDGLELVTGSLRRAAGASDERVVVAEVDGILAGAAYLQLGQFSPLLGDTGVHVSHLQVDPRYARHGVGQALLQYALSWAEQTGASTLLVASLSSDRETNRFFARRGLAQSAVLRAASVGTLRAWVPHDPATVARSTDSQRRRVGRIVAARRSQRRARQDDTSG